MLLVGPGRWRESEDIGLEIADVGIRHAGVGRVGEDWEIVASVRRDTVSQGVMKLVVGPVAYSVIRVGCDVGAVKGAKRRIELPSTREQRATVRRISMARRTSGRFKDIFTPRYSVLLGGRFFRPGREEETCEKQRESLAGHV